MEELLEAYLKESEIGYHKDYDDDGDPIFNMECTLEHDDFPIFVINAREYETVNLYVKSPIKIPEPKCIAVAEYITRANFHNYEGALMLDFDDGSLFYKNALRYDPKANIEHIPYQLNISLGLGMDEMETHFPGILNVLYNDMEPAQALTKAEYGSNAKLN